MPKDVAMPIESVIGQSVSSRSCRAEPAAPRRMPAAAKRRGRRQGEGPPTPVKMAEQHSTVPVQYRYSTVQYRYSTGKVEYTLDWLWTNLRWSEVGKPPQCWMQRRCWLPQRGFVRCRH